MKVFQKEISLGRYHRGFHLVTDKILNEFPEIKKINAGLLQIFIKHTSAGLTINENADPAVRFDFESHFNRMVPENEQSYQHNDEGADDMPAHIKSSIIGNQLTIPLTSGTMNLGIWQGIYLCEFRNSAGNRRVVLTAIGE